MELLWCMYFLHEVHDSLPAPWNTRQNFSSMVVGGLDAKSCLTLVTPWTVACQAPLSMRFFRQKYWSGLQCSPPRDLPKPGIEPTSFTFHALASEFFTTSATYCTKEVYS